MRIRLQRIISTSYDYSGKRRLDLLECGHTVTVRRPTSRKDKLAIEAAKSRRCPECIKRD